MQISSKTLQRPEQQRSQCLIVGVYSKGSLRGAAKTLDSASGGLINRLLKRGDNKGDWATTLMLSAVDGIAAERLLLVGLGDGSAVGEADYRKLVQAVLSALIEHKLEDAVWLPEDIAVKERDTAWQLTQLAIAA